MTYNPKTHLLRPLEPEEIVENSDIYANGFVYLRPVPIPTGWRPRSEAACLAGLDARDDVVWSVKDGTIIRSAKASILSGAYAFYIIPPCDLPPPDPERERFEKWWYEHASADAVLCGIESAFLVWQAAARKENV